MVEAYLTRLATLRYFCAHRIATIFLELFSRHTPIRAGSCWILALCVLGFGSSIFSRHCRRRFAPSIARPTIRQRQSLTTRSRRTASPPLNSSVRRQSIFLLCLLRIVRFAFHTGGVVGQRALTYFVALSCLACCARFSVSPPSALHRARSSASSSSSLAARSACARHHPQGIAGHQRQRYRAAIPRRGGPPS